MYDVVIAGGGPAGSSAASYLRLKNRRVLLLERERFPRFHLGESLLPFGIDLFRELGVFEEIDRRYIHKPGARFLHEESGASFTFYFDRAIDPGRPYAYQVPRADFDKLLLDNSGRLGAEVRQETTVRKVIRHTDRVEVVARGSDGTEYAVEASMFVDATGRDALLATELGLKVPDGGITTNVACFTHFENALRQEGSDEGNFTGILFDGGWWWFIPFKGNITSVGVVFEKEYTMARRGKTPQELFEGAVAEQREIKKILAHATRVRPIDTTGNWSYRSKCFHGDRYLIVGDAAAFIDPLFSTGVLMAMAGGKFAAEAIDTALTAGDFRSDRFADYQERCLAGADLFKKLVHEFYGEDLRRLLIHSGDNPTMVSIIVSLLAGDVYKKAVWQSAVSAGFSQFADLSRVPGQRRVRTIRQNKDAAK
ncbi:MAG: NAD(P)/FAD-dependent oxidoreductase [Myxococcales bacterium]|nr:NAD(P)/FAD-dependent oxidoreductase [Myxococcales bacterium]